MKPRWRAIVANRVRPGDTVWWRGEAWTVERNYCHPRSPYAKMNLNGADIQNMYTSRTIGKYDRIWLKVYDPFSP